MKPVAADERGLLAHALAAELRTVLTEARTLTDLLALDLPQLDAALEASDASRDCLAERLEQAVHRLQDPVYCSAAQDLFPLPYADTGWPKLAARGRLAGGRFNISYDGFRRSAEGRPSRLDDVLRQVAESLLHVLADSEQQAQGDSSTTTPRAAVPADRAGDQAAEDGSQSNSRRFPVVVAAAASTAVMVVLLFAWLVRDSSRPRPSSSLEGSFRPEACELAVGLLDEQLVAEPDAPQLTKRLVSTYRSATVAASTCPTAPAYRWQSIVVQELGRDGRGDGAVLVSPNNVDLYLNNAAWGSYHQIGGKTGTAAQITGGLPVRMVTFADSHVEIELSTGTIMVAERIDAPYFWIPAVFVPWWHDHFQQVGRPTGNPLPTLRQDFEKGVVSVTPAQPGLPVFTPIDQPMKEIPAPDVIRERMLTQADGTTWLISADGKRLWIPDGKTWDCLGGDARRVARDLPGYAIASLPFGGQAKCLQ